ncbi:glycosyltransferase [Streptomyces oceani]|uniref:glycosyltransferase n=1 Tax=Streptomyces oceani TaxID=1075402 RepID=UPI00147D4A2E|nr:glycosyltransferase [Streptomyces oceani]
MVVPLNGSSAQLQECLRSLAEQTLRDLEVVLVDSGGPEGAERRALAERFAAVDGRFRLVRHPPGEPGNPDNRAEPGSAGGMVGSGGAGGAGDARAAGLREVDPGSRFLAFCDGADRLPPTAYELLTDSLTASGSDLACGDLLRLRHTGSTSSTSGTSGTGRPASDSEPAAAEHDPAAWTLSAHGPLRKAMDQPRQRTHITRHPALVQDRTLRNKVFRHAFWTHRQLPWPARTPSHAGRLGPDTALALPAHYLAESVDVLTEPVCHWREQPSARSTASPVRTDQAALRADVAVLEEVSRRLAEHAAEDGGAAERHYAALVLAGDLLAYLKALPAADEEFRALFTRLAAGFLTRVDPRVLDGLPVGRRMKWQLVREHRTTDLLHALAFERENPRVFETTGPRARRAAYLRPDGSGITVPDRASRPLREDLPLRTKLHAVDWLPDGRGFRTRGCRTGTVGPARRRRWGGERRHGRTYWSGRARSSCTCTRTGRTGSGSHPSGWRRTAIGRCCTPSTAPTTSTAAPSPPSTRSPTYATGRTRRCDGCVSASTRARCAHTASTGSNKE